MRSLVGILILLFLASPSDAARRRAVSPGGRSLSAVDSAAAAALARGVPGVVVAVAIGDSSTTTSAYGQLDIARDAPMTTHSVLQIGSITKQFTAALIMRLAERGAIALSSSVVESIPELGPAAQSITIEHLLTHTSGLSEFREIAGSRPRSSDEYLRILSGRPLEFTPGENWRYTNTNYYLLGLLIERVVGRPYAEVLTDEILAPAGLIRTGYCDSSRVESIPEGYVLGPNGSAMPAGRNDFSLSFAAGGICSTANDLIRWTRALSTGAVVSHASYVAMTTPGTRNDGTPFDYGYGLGVTELFGRKAIVHGGKVPGFSAHLVHYPSENVTIAVLTNLSSLRDDAALIAEDIARVLLEK
jgi:D-alanyl-D-alanine carboxypeptidase